METAHAILLAIIEGLTEFLPVSSTGHMIIASSGLGIADLPFTKTFTVAIQLGAILAVVALYWKKFINFKDPKFYFKLAIAVVPGGTVVTKFPPDEFIVNNPVELLTI